MRPVILLMGPTACGKTALAVQLAQHFAVESPFEIISVDSVLVYRGMDIGTAKPTVAEQGGIPHHLMDIREPTAVYSAAQFRSDALGLIAAIHGRGHIPCLVGGTMLYFRALRFGLDDLPAADAGLRAELEARATHDGWPALHAELAQLDPLTAARLAPNDSQRIQRALEICHLSGQPMSALLVQQKAAAVAPAYRWLDLLMLPGARAALHVRIAQRFDAMLTAGFLDEVRTLRARGDLRPELPAMRSVGYRQAWDYLDGACDAATFRERGIAATRQLAKRQITWLRSWPRNADTLDLDCLAPTAAQQARDWLVPRMALRLARIQGA